MLSMEWVENHNGPSCSARKTIEARLPDDIPCVPQTAAVLGCRAARGEGYDRLVKTL
jgi:hypothetical protein